MGIRKLKLTTLFFGDKSPQKLPSWAWPSCRDPKTHSLRFDNHRSNVYLFDNSTATTDSVFTHSSGSEEYLSDTVSLASDDDSETVIRSLERSERLLFEPGGYTSSILMDEATTTYNTRNDDDDDDDDDVSGLKLVQFSKESVAVAMESVDPYSDFRRSMEEMVMAHHHHRDCGHDDDDDDDDDDWEWLEELLVWYLRVNKKRNHGFIVGAFVDLLVGLAISNCCEGVNEKMIRKEELLVGDVSSSSNCMSSISHEIEEEEDESSGSC